jgi:DNA-binding response OmpR family regulator
MSEILIVDDQLCIQELLSEALSHDGYCVVTAGDVEAAKVHLRCSRPDLVLLDLYLDGPEGFLLFHDIKREAPRLPIIIFTSYDSYREDSRLSGADACVIKSFDFAELKEKIAQVLSVQPAQSRAERDA